MEKFLDDRIDILMLCQNDWANTCYRFSKCLEKIGLKSVVLKGNPHKFNYPEQAMVTKTLQKCVSRYPLAVQTGDDTLLKLMKHASVINFHASTFVNHTKFNYNGKKLVVTHGGTTYRKNPDASNRLFNGICHSTVIQCPDLLNLGAKNEHLIYYPVDTDFIKPKYDRIDPDKLSVGHFPSSGKVKGSEGLTEFCKSLQEEDEKFKKFELNFTTNSVSWEQNIERMQNCDIYIEALNLTNSGRKYGEWGNTCIEAAASGCIVITHCLSRDIYREQYKRDFPILVANSYSELRNHLENLLEMSDKEILNLKNEFREWVETTHSFQTTGERLWTEIYKPLFPDRRFDDQTRKVVFNKKPVKKMMIKLDDKYQTCLVTGGAGFIGSHICEELLKQGRKVKCVDNFVNGKAKNIEKHIEDPNFKMINASVTDILKDESLLAEFRGVDVVFHEACGKCTVCLHDPKLDLEVNAWGSFNVFEASRLAGVKKIVHASTGSVYGEPQYFPEDEKHPYNPASFYGVSKLAGERYLEVFSKMYGLKYSILRYFHVYGIRQDSADLGGVIPIFIRNVLKNEEIKIYGDGSQIRSFTYVKDIVKANFLCANEDSADGECYNVASGIKISILELANKIKELANKPEIAIKNYDWRLGDIKYFDVSNEKIRNLGLSLDTDIDTNLKELIDWYDKYLQTV